MLEYPVGHIPVLGFKGHDRAKRAASYEEVRVAKSIADFLNKEMERLGKPKKHTFLYCGIASHLGIPQDKVETVLVGIGGGGTGIQIWCPKKA